MTIPHWGKITPLQADMLGLAGHVVTDPAASEEQRRKAIARGRWELKKSTGQDFGFDLRAWHQHLIATQSEEYCHPYAWRTVSPAIERAIEDAERLQLVAALQHEPKKLSSEGLALAIVEELIRAGFLEQRQLQSAVPVVREEIKDRKILG